MLSCSLLRVCICNTQPTTHHRHRQQVSMHSGDQWQRHDSIHHRAPPSIGQSQYHLRHATAITIIFLSMSDSTCVVPRRRNTIGSFIESDTKPKQLARRHLTSSWFVSATIKDKGDKRNKWLTDYLSNGLVHSNLFSTLSISFRRLHDRISESTAIDAWTGAGAGSDSWVLYK